jgi:hypothetical protein
MIANAEELLSLSGMVVLLPPVFALSFAPFFAPPAATRAVAGDDIREILAPNTAEGEGQRRRPRGGGGRRRIRRRRGSSSLGGVKKLKSIFSFPAPGKSPELVSPRSLVTKAKCHTLSLIY